ncbi:unnamed protein product [Linum trigynum]|uniref:Uncharacterized protein n=1 Tax=Linum trigynum TaxID=586398 RepID=A0AAV2CXP3_9ROSI
MSSARRRRMSSSRQRQTIMSRPTPASGWGKKYDLLGNDNTPESFSWRLLQQRLRRSPSKPAATCERREGQAGHDGGRKRGSRWWGVVGGVGGREVVGSDRGGGLGRKGRRQFGDGRRCTLVRG